MHYDVSPVLADFCLYPFDFTWPQIRNGYRMPRYAESRGLHARLILESVLPTPQPNLVQEPKLSLFGQDFLRVPGCEAHHHMSGMQPKMFASQASRISPALRVFFRL